MGSVIEMVAVAENGLFFMGNRYLKLAAAAARRCLLNAGRKSKDMGMIVNTGVYKDNNLGEPALASLIQKRIGAVSTPDLFDNKVCKFFAIPFSFDINNGGCGWMSGLQVVDGFIQTGDIFSGMVVTCDTEPFGTLFTNYKYHPLAAAVILSSGRENAGFIDFQSKSFPQYRNKYKSYVVWKHGNGRKMAVNELKVDIQEDFVDLCVKSALTTLENLLKSSKLKLSDIDLFIPSQSPTGFVEKLAQQIGMADRIVQMNHKNKEYFTAGPALALEKVWRNGSFRRSRYIVFLSVGSGITTACALYKNK
ncbi:hypothetical protein JW935_04280 [candidate division KSB1 bacterium]|nr:hypothetical protein [candidate division KSB1 bacterium]